MSALTIPYAKKYKADAGGAGSFDIEIKWKVTNSNDVPVWVAAGVVLIHRRGLRWGFTSTAYDEAWAIYHPAEGFVTDFSQQRYAEEVEVNIGRGISEALGFLMGGGTGSTMYNQPDRQFTVDPRVHCTMKRPRAYVLKGPRGGRVRYGMETAVEVPPRSTIEYTPILNIPGPGASDGMAKFWADNGGSPDFDVQIEVYQLAHYGVDTPPMERAELQPDYLLGKEMLRDAFELKLEDKVGFFYGEVPPGF